MGARTGLVNKGQACDGSQRESPHAIKLVALGGAKERSLGERGVSLRSRTVEGCRGRAVPGVKQRLAAAHMKAGFFLLAATNQSADHVWDFFGK